MARPQEPEWLGVLAGPRARTSGTAKGRCGDDAGEKRAWNLSEARDLVEAAIARMADAPERGSKPGMG